MSDHPAYAKAPAKRRWSGSELSAVYLALEQETRDRYVTKEELAADQGWAWRILPRGLVIALRRHKHCNRLELRIARVDAPTDDDGWRRWKTEVGVVLKKFAVKVLDGSTPCQHEGWEWYEVPPQKRPQDDGKAAVRYLELREGEISPERARCWGHPRLFGEELEVEWFPGSSVKNQLCERCRTAKGQGKLPDE